MPEPSHRGDGYGSGRRDEPYIDSGCHDPYELTTVRFVRISETPILTFHSFLNSDGKCYAFDARGEGYGRGEGAGIVVLKRLDDALRAGDNIRGVIRGSGVGQDGRTAGITLPNRAAQQSLINSVYHSAGLGSQKDETAYFEAHGTGTLAGDTTELGAIGDAFCDGDGRDRDSPLYIGSIKANIGHLESSSVGGLIV